MNELAKRIGTAAVLLLVVVGVLALNETGIGPAPWMLFVAVACGVAAWEWARLLGLGCLGQIAYLAASALLVSALMPPALENAVWLAFGLWIIALLRIAGVPFPRTVETLFFWYAGVGGCSGGGTNPGGFLGTVCVGVSCGGDRGGYGCLLRRPSVWEDRIGSRDFSGQDPGRARRCPAGGSGGQYPDRVGP